MSSDNTRKEFGIKPMSNGTYNRQFFIPLNPGENIVTSQYVRFNTPNYYRSANPICAVVSVSPSAPNDDIVDLDKISFIEELNMANEMDTQTEAMKLSISTLISMMYEIALIIYWVIKILMTIFVISMILWMFIWFYKLIQKLLGEL
jgi:hypothetical protein